MEKEILSNLVITRVHSATTLYSPAGARSRRSNRSCWAILLKYEGETIYHADGKRFLSDPNHPILLPCGCSYEWECTKEGHFATVEFEGSPGFSEPISFSLSSSHELLSLMKGLEHKRTLGGHSVELESKREVYSMLLLLTKAKNNIYMPVHLRQKLAPALLFLSEHYDQSPTNDALAAMTGLSTVYFRKLFTRLMGDSPIAYLHKLRIEKAKEMLRCDYSSLTDIALSLGYPSLYDFSRAFKKHTGVCPSRYMTK